MLGTAITVLISMTDVNASPADDIKAVAGLDTQYQNAVKRTAEGSEREASDL